MITISLADRERLIDELIKSNQDSTIGNYINELREIMDEVKNIENESQYTE